MLQRHLQQHAGSAPAITSVASTDNSAEIPLGDPIPVPAVAVPSAGSNELWPALQRQPGKPVKLQYPAQSAECPGFTLEFEAHEIDLGDTYISLLVPATLFFLPGGVMNFVLFVQGRNYPVKWVGGSFRFTTKGFHCISFLRDKPAEQKARTHET